ncbi:hypothetical protein [Nostoc sp.]|uniref:hypothetical protein n=1 Tax=Nostoc sp. TaxID=1180 RepID=UPI002FF9F5A1
MNIRLVYQAFSTTAALLLLTSGAFFSQTVFAADFKPTPLIVDDDGSQDGMTALAYMLANPKFDIQAITPKVLPVQQAL